MGKGKCLKPIRMWIDGKCYNITRYDKKKYDSMRNTVGQEKVENKEMPFSTKIVLPSIYYSKLEKYRNPQLNTLQIETNTIIKYPAHGKNGFLEISGKSEESIEEARLQMHSFIADIRNQLSALQFIGIPLLSNEIKQNFQKFKEEILLKNYKGVEESIFQSALKLHLTIAVFTLLTEEEKKVAQAVLEEVKATLQDIKKPLKIRIEGLNCMNDDYSKVNVLYAEASLTENSDASLQSIANSISNSFYESGLSREYSENVKLHMTVMNTKYRKREEGTPKRKWVRRETFDATHIMEQFKDYYFGNAIFDTIHLCLMSSKGEDGFYKTLATIRL